MRIDQSINPYSSEKTPSHFKLNAFDLVNPPLSEIQDAQSEPQKVGNAAHVIEESEASMVPPEWPVLSPTRSRSPKRGPGRLIPCTGSSKF